jgi:hypothetical protein
MTIPSAPAPDRFLSLLGVELDDPRVQASLTQFAHGMQPELDPDDDRYFDWVTVNELGLEYGFVDGPHLRAADLDDRWSGPLVLFQVFFYGETDTMRAYPFPLPFGLALQDDRATVRRKLAQYEHLRRDGERDFWALPEFHLAIAYSAQRGTIETVFCYLPDQPFTPKPGEAQLVARFTPERLRQLFGLRWSSEELRTEFAPFGYDAALPDVRSEHAADFAHEHGLSLVFVPASQIPAADQSSPGTLVLGGASFYAAREEDAREWEGELPLGLKFSDIPRELPKKLGKSPSEKSDERFGSTAVWQFPEFTLSVVYSTLENRLLKVTIYAPGFWSSISAN